MISTCVNIYEVEVALGEANALPAVSFGGPDIHSGLPLRLPQGIHMIRFQIAMESEAVFPSTPILWMREDGFGAEELPPGIIVRWQNPKQFALVVFNAVGLSHQFHCRVVVSAGDLVVVSPDPTIICDPPGTPPPIC